MLQISHQIMVRIQLYKQGLLTMSQTKEQSTPIKLLERLGYIQLDSINVISRSQDLFLVTFGRRV